MIVCNAGDHKMITLVRVGIIAGGVGIATIATTATTMDVLLFAIHNHYQGCIRHLFSYINRI